MLLVKKRDVTLRLCIDYMQLNKVTIKNKCPLSWIDELFDQLKRATMFSKIELRLGYHQVHIKERTSTRYNFIPVMGKFAMVQLGLTNASTTFMCMMNSVLHPHQDKFVIVFIDDILIYSKNKEEHAKHLAAVLRLLREHKLYAKLSKWSFFHIEVHYSGHVVSK